MSKSSDSKPEINVTPLIDVLLVLLIIFMVVSPVKPSKFDARVPSEPTDDRNVGPNPKTLVVTVDATTSLGLNSEKLDATVASPEALIARLKDVFSARELKLENERTVFIKAPKNIDYGAVAKVVDAVKMSGAAPISLQIDRLD
jgi:biopolymer transport protein ExbD